MALVPFPNQAPAPVPDDDLDPDDRDDELEDQEDAGGKMSFLEHLDELRRRIIYALLSFLGGFVIAFSFIRPIFDFIMRPMQELLPEGGTLVYTNPTEAFVLYIKIAAIAGLIIASPAVMAQVWLFIAPGLYAHEKRWAIPFIAISSFFFVAGTAFAHFVVFPFAWRFFVGFTTDILTFMPRIEPAFSMYLRLVLAFGVVFQMPTLVLFLARMGVLTAGFMVRNFRFAVLIIAIVSAVITPPDVISMIAMAGPLIVLYWFSIGLAWLVGRKRNRPQPT